MTQRQSQDGWRLLDAGDNEAARAKFSEAIAANPRDSDALIGLGKALARLGQASEALDAFKAATNLDPENPEAHYGAGSAYSQLGQATEALDAFKAALHFDPENPEAHYGAAWSYDQRGEREDAEFHARKAVALAPDVAKYHLLAAKCISGKDMETKLWHLEAANRLESGGLDRRWRPLLIYLRVFAGFAYPIQRLLMVWAMLATLYSCTLSAAGRQWWFLAASLPFLATTIYNLSKRRYYRAIWSFGLCLLWAVPAYLLVERLLSQ